MVAANSLIKSVILIVFISSSASADGFGHFQGGFSAAPHQVQRVPERNVTGAQNRPLGNNARQRSPKVLHVPQGQDHQMKNDGFHAEINNNNGRGHIERFHQLYYPWGVYPNDYYYDSSPSVEATPPDSDNQVDQGYQDQTPNDVQPKVIKILPNGSTITNQ